MSQSENVHISAARLVAFAHGRSKLTKSESNHFDRCHKCYEGLKDVMKQLRFIPIRKIA